MEVNAAKKMRAAYFSIRQQFWGKSEKVFSMNFGQSQFICTLNAMTRRQVISCSQSLFDGADTYFFIKEYEERLNSGKFLRRLSYHCKCATRYDYNAHFFDHVHSSQSEATEYFKETQVLHAMVDWTGRLTPILHCENA